MSRFVPEKLRRFVFQRAGFACEYCRIHQSDLIFSAHIDHIISIKHGGTSIPSNLAGTCLICNGNKGSDIGTVVYSDEVFVRFFNPRKEEWREHFELTATGLILPKTTIGEGTVKILDFNDEERVQQRRLLMDIGRYPPLKR